MSIDNSLYVDVSVRDIKIPRRIRNRNVDIDDLVESLAEFGLLQPILIDRSNQLIAGYRRLEAAKSLGWELIEVRIIDAPQMRQRLLIEIEENSVRQDFRKEDLDRAKQLLKRFEHKGPFGRAWNWLLDWADRIFHR